MKKTLLTLAASLLMPLTVIHAVEVENLRCEYLENPLGIDVAKPRLSWKLETGDLKPERGIKQTAYQVLVASTPELLAKDQGDLWDSGRSWATGAFKSNIPASRSCRGRSAIGRCVCGKKNPKPET
jgi:hypothetical protein